ncbi:tyrosine-protein phosphatase [Paenibacillus protaetiae]|nr:tyrosine-protein phosphatase [Paenibacillus protaetiae]
MTQVLERFSTYPAERVIPFEGPRNFRDMGGYPAADGRKVKYGILFRADDLSVMTEEDIAFMKTLNIKTIFDYRSDDEAEMKPDPVMEGVLNVRVPAIAGNQYRSPEDLFSDSFLEQFDNGKLDNLYGEMAIGNASYKRLIELLADPERLGLVHHCAAGKDRTGVGSAIILSLLGVPRDIIIEDYLITNETLSGMHEQMLGHLAGKVSEAHMAIFSRMMSASAEFLEAAFRAIESKYGTMEAYFEEEFGLTEDKIESIRSRCLE